MEPQSTELAEPLTAVPMRQEPVALQSETATTSAAAQARASVEARYVMALKRPRNWDQVRTNLLKDCGRPGFARVARYRKPVGNKAVDGPSIRFAEAAMRHMGNLLPESVTIFDDPQRRIVRVMLTDLEANLTYTKDLTIEKVVERSRLRPGQAAISSRINSQGNPVFTVAATEDDLLTKENALTSKALRGHALRVLPGDILEECMDKVKDTQRDEAAKDPDAERKAIIDAFVSVGVQPAQLQEYVGHDIGTMQPAELVELRAVFAAVRDGEATWAEAMDVRSTKEPAPVTAAAPPAPATPPKTLGEVVARKKGAKQEPQLPLGGK